MDKLNPVPPLDMSEEQLLAEDLAYNDFKNSGRLAADEAHRALERELNSGAAS